MSAVIVGVSGVSFGATDPAFGFMQTFDEGFESDETTAMNGQGDHVAASYHSKKGEVTADLIIQDEANAPTLDDIGSTLTLSDATHDIIVRVISKSRSNTGWLSMRIVGSIFPEFAQPATTTTTTTTV